ncbi:phage/plasmid primase, P4 family [Martelella radicis]|uniref:Putative DNA primase/helicase n=1 Tax=Martelella radicis TaxID=1397476 RepID=A0A7W6KHS2_9HYPH|nr:phage/plasmid primase, P4 family [Martelella radicis]MBB4120218.1 putative DNA primase/helicase [Martelella radicis]
MENLDNIFGDLMGASDPETNKAVAAGPRNGFEKHTEAEQLLETQYHKAPKGPAAIAPLAKLARWVAWREEERNSKPTKVPYSTPRQMARANDPATWLSRAAAETLALDLLSGGRKGGVGLMLGGDKKNRLGGIDLDSCRDPATGDLTGWASEIVERFGSYTEVSPSQTGLKVFFRYAAADMEALQKAMGTKHGKSWSRGSHHEIALHLGNRYFTVTEQALPGHADTLALITKTTLNWLIEEAGPRFKGEADIDKEKRDESRSGRAFRLAGECRRAGQTFEQFRSDLAEDPDLADWANDMRQVKRAWERTRGDIDLEDEFEDMGEDIDGFPMTEDGVARAFAAAHADRLRFCHSSGRWHVWTGSHWRKEETKLAFNWAREICRARAAADVKSSAAKALAKAATSAAVERFAQADRAFAVTADAWDSDHWLLGTPGGTVDLRTGELREARQTDMITKITAAAPIPSESFDPAKHCPRWLAFLEFATGGDADAIRFLQQWFGYSLTGDTREEALLFVHGIGGSGKSTTINTIAALLGDYATAVDPETITAQKHGRHSTEIARLHGARMAYASETEAGRAWAENRIKQLTGGDVMTARFMRQDDFEFKPQLKLVVIGNNKPAFANVDGAIKRRFNVMPFDHKPAHADHGLKASLEAEFAGILSWAIQGCLDWQKHGLCRPAVMVETTNEYFAEMDLFSNWLVDRCETGPRYAATTEDLFDSWSWYARQNGEEPGNRFSDFPQRMRERGFLTAKNIGSKRARGYSGIRIAPQPEQFDDFDDLGASTVETGMKDEKCLTH